MHSSCTITILLTHVSVSTTSNDNDNTHICVVSVIATTESIITLAINIYIINHIAKAVHISMCTIMIILTYCHEYNS